MPGPNQPRNALADPMGYMREVSAVNRRQTAEMRAMDEAERAQKSKADAQRSRIRKMMAPKPKPPGPRYENVMPMTDEARANMALTEEMLRIKRERRNALTGS